MKVYNSPEYKASYLNEFITILRNTDYPSHDAWVDAMQNFIAAKQDEARLESDAITSNADIQALLAPIKQNLIEYKKAYHDLDQRLVKINRSLVEERAKNKNTNRNLVAMFERGVLRGEVQALHVIDTFDVPWPETTDKATNRLLEQVTDDMRAVYRTSIMDMLKHVSCNATEHKDIFESGEDQGSYKPVATKAHKTNDDGFDVDLAPATFTGAAGTWRQVVADTMQYTAMPDPQVHEEE